MVADAAALTAPPSIEQPADPQGFALFVDALPADIEALCQRGVLPAGGTLASWLRSYTAWLRDQASGRAGSLATARAALDNERREEVQARVALKLGELLPVGDIGEAVARAARQVAGVLDSLVPRIRMHWPTVPAERLQTVEAALVRSRNALGAADPDTMLAGTLASLQAGDAGLHAAVRKALALGLAALSSPVPLRASQWADRHFYLSAESSYIEGAWKTWPFQRAMLDCMAHDEIRSVTIKKAARVGYSKMMLATVGYLAQHKRRNLVVYQPTEEDADDWVRTELDTMLRDVPIMASVFPAFLRRSKDNTLKTKRFLGSTAFVRGGKAAKNYRRLTVDAVLLDELDGFDRDVEKEGSPTRLSAKRLEGALFPKHIKGSTPKLTGYSLIDEEHDAAALQFKFHVPCPHCGTDQPLEWGGKGASHGFRWPKDNPEQVLHHCVACGVGFSQAEYLQVWERGRWVAQDGSWIDPECRFRAREGAELPAPESVAFHVWTAYSPQASWPGIVAEFLAARRTLKTGDHTAMKTWVNTTRGLSFKLEGSKTDADLLRERARAETYRLRLCPRACLVLTCGIDVQDDRLVATVWGWGRGEEAWVIDDRVFLSDPGQWYTWQALDTYLSTRFPHEGGQRLAIDAVAVDTGGHQTHAVYRWVMARESRRVHAIQGSSQRGKPIVAGTPSKKDVNADGQIVKDGVKLWSVGTDTAKDLLFNRLRIQQPGAGYIHFSPELEASFFDELVAEERLEQRTARGVESRWVNVKQRRNERLDTAVYNLFCAARMKLHQWTDAEWSRLELALCPPSADLFAPAALEPLPPPAPLPAPDPGPADKPAAPTPAAAPAPAAGPPAERQAELLLPSLGQTTPRPARRVRGAARLPW